jgi:hypothetical protein
MKMSLGKSQDSIRDHFVNHFGFDPARAGELAEQVVKTSNDLAGFAGCAVEALEYDILRVMSKPISFRNRGETDEDFINRLLNTQEKEDGTKEMVD